MKFIIDVLFWALIIGISLFVVKYLAVWMAPFILGLILATLLQPPISAVLRGTRLRRGLVAPVITLAMVAMSVGLLAVCSIRLLGEASAFLIHLPGWFRETAPAVVAAITARFEKLIEALPFEWEQQIRIITYDLLQGIQTELGRLSSMMVSTLANMATALPGLLVGLILTFVATFFMTADYDMIRAAFFRWIPAKYKDLVLDTGGAAGKTLARMLRSYALIMFITFCELTASFILLKLDYAVTLAAIIALVDILPVLGTGTVLLPWGAVSLLMGDARMGIGILLTYVVITVLRNILEPRIIGRRIGLHPLATLIFMYLGLHVLGVAGMFLFPLGLILVKNARAAGLLRGPDHA